MYIFEDHKEDSLSKLFRECYPEEMQSKFLYSNGNGGIASKIQEAINLGENEISVFMDMVPGNNDAITIYNNLYRQFGKQCDLMVYPIICTEYYFLSMLYSLGFNEYLSEIPIGKCVNSC